MSKRNTGGQAQMLVSPPSTQPAGLLREQQGHRNLPLLTITSNCL